ncbi:MAG: hypothetical protein CFE37_00345 [Alphaproteobacteria bacterium PA4]|nr:MAG: hypothetical protein CFE37_00345 [Alphaproteobacteria bacterium PA4]
MTGANITAETPWLHLQLYRVRQRWWLPLVGLVVGFGLAILFLRQTEYLYAAELKIYPAASPSDKRLPGALATLAGQGGESAAVSPFQTFIAGIHAPDVAARLARDPALMHIIFAAQWDGRQNSWHAPSPGLIDGALSYINTALGRSTTPWRAPDAMAMQHYIADSVQVQQSALSPMSTVHFSHTDPMFAARFLSAVTDSTVRWLREQQTQRTADHIAFLSQQLRHRLPAGERRALLLALAQAEQRGMRNSGSTPYAIEYFDGVQVSPEPAKPRVVALVLGASIAGLGLGLILALLPLPAGLQRGGRGGQTSR